LDGRNPKAKYWKISYEGEKLVRILIISYFFPPFNIIGAVRVGKIAKYLDKLGHEVKVISAKNQPLQESLPLEISEEKVIYTKWISINKPLKKVFRDIDSIVYSPSRKSEKKFAPNFWEKMIKIYRTLFYFPDCQIGWYPFARKAAKEVVRGWKPDLIYSSAPPFTSLIVAYSVAQKHNIPWVAELRDLWVDNAYYENRYLKCRKVVEAKLESRVLSTATGLVTVSEPLAHMLKTKYRKPVAVILNGFDPEDFPPSITKNKDDLLRIVYTGSIYSNRQDPTPIFQALKNLGPLANKIRVIFYGEKLGIIRKLAAQFGLINSVETNPPVPYREALKIQREADVLLLLLWNDLKEKGVYTGKLFEYIGARRPILAIGPADNVAAKLIQERKAGIVLREPEEIERRLYCWLLEKQYNRTISDLSEEVTLGLSREEQVQKLNEFLRRVIVLKE